MPETFKRMSAADFRKQNTRTGGNVAPDPRMQLRGLTNQQVGKMFETMLDTACVHYRHEGCARIKKVPEPFVMVAPLGEGMVKGYYASPADPDYMGTMNGGRGISFDAKATRTETLRQDIVTHEQWEALDEHLAMGAYAFVICTIQFKQYYRVPWVVWRDMKAIYGRKHMNAADLAEYQLPVRNGKVMFLHGLTDGRRPQ